MHAATNSEGHEQSRDGVLDQAGWKCFQERTSGERHFEEAAGQAVKPREIVTDCLREIELFANSKSVCLGDAQPISEHGKFFDRHRLFHQLRGELQVRVVRVERRLPKAVDHDEAALLSQYALRFCKRPLPIGPLA